MIPHVMRAEVSLSAFWQQIQGSVLYEAVGLLLIALVVFLCVFPKGWRLLNGHSRAAGRGPIVSALLASAGVVRVFCAAARAARRLSGADTLFLVRARIEAELLGAALQRVDVRQRRATLELANIFPLTAHDERIRRYFDLLATAGIPPAEQAFVCAIEIGTSYLAPTHLLHGLQSQFHEDWVRCLDEYNAVIREEHGPRKDQRALQRSIFQCWLVWGPSVSICTCDQWRHNALAFQLGYGDEDNSLPYLVPGGPAVDRLKQEFGDAGTPAIPVAVEVGLKSVRAIGEHDLSVAQESIRTGRRYGFVLTHRQAPTRQNRNNLKHNYYTSYLWILFVDERQHRLNPTAPWDSMLPFFVHANIANAVTFESGQRALVRLALSYVESLLATQGEASATDAPRFLYACAFDSPECDGTPLLRDATLGRTGPSTADLLRAELADRESVAKALAWQAEEATETASRAELAERSRRARLLCEAVRVEPNPILLEYSACRLQEVIDRYLAILQASPAGSARPRGAAVDGASRAGARQMEARS